MTSARGRIRARGGCRKCKAAIMPHNRIRADEPPHLRQVIAGVHVDKAQVVRTGVDPAGMHTLRCTRYHFGRSGIGQDLSHIPWGSKTFRLPPLRLAEVG